MNEKMNYSIEHPTAYKKSNKPVKTHLDEIQFKKSGGTEVGTYYAILRTLCNVHNVKQQDVDKVSCGWADVREISHVTGISK